jgi:hypothetical protein
VTQFNIISGGVSPARLRRAGKAGFLALNKKGTLLKFDNKEYSMELWKKIRLSGD